MGTAGHSGFRKLIPGDVASGVLKHSPLSCNDDKVTPYSKLYILSCLLRFSIILAQVLHFLLAAVTSWERSVTASKVLNIIEEKTI
jgi:hypothetical protein